MSWFCIGPSTVIYEGVSYESRLLSSQILIGWNSSGEDSKWVGAGEYDQETQAVRWLEGHAKQHEINTRLSSLHKSDPAARHKNCKWVAHGRDEGDAAEADELS